MTHCFFQAVMFLILAAGTGTAGDAHKNPMKCVVSILCTYSVMSSQHKVPHPILFAPF